MIQAIALAENLHVGQFDRACFASRDGKEADLEEIVADVFEQRRVALAADNLFVGAAGVVFGQHLAFQDLPIDGHLEIADGGVGRQGEEIAALHRLRRVVAQALGQVNLGYRAIDCDINLLLLNAHGIDYRHRRRYRSTRRRVDDNLGKRRGAAPRQQEGQQEGDNDSILCEDTIICERSHTLFPLIKGSPVP